MRIIFILQSIFHICYPYFISVHNMGPYHNYNGNFFGLLLFKFFFYLDPLNFSDGSGGPTTLPLPPYPSPSFHVKCLGCPFYKHLRSGNAMLSVLHVSSKTLSSWDAHSIPQCLLTSAMMTRLMLTAKCHFLHFST